MTRISLVFFLISIALSALLGVAALLGGDFSGWLVLKLLGTTACCSGASLLALACAPAIERRRWLPLPHIGVAAAFAGYGAITLMLWVEDGSEGAFRLTIAALTIAHLMAYISLLGLLRCGPKATIIQYGSFGAATLVSLMVLVVSLGAEPDEGFFILLGVVLLGLLASTLVTPLARRLEGLSGLPPMLRCCPSCGVDLKAKSPDEGTCQACDSAVRIRFHDAKTSEATQ